MTPLVIMFDPQSYGLRSTKQMVDGLIRGQILSWVNTNRSAPSLVPNRSFVLVGVMGTFLPRTLTKCERLSRIQLA